VKLSDQTCPWSGWHSVDTPQHPLTDQQAAVLPGLVAVNASGLLRCSRCGAVYVPSTFKNPPTPLGIIEDFEGCRWVSWGMAPYDLTSAPRPLGAEIVMSHNLVSACHADGGAPLGGSKRDGAASTHVQLH
jgi:hypothetical protein